MKKIKNFIIVIISLVLIALLTFSVKNYSFDVTTKLEEQDYTGAKIKVTSSDTMKSLKIYKKVGNMYILFYMSHHGTKEVTVRIPNSLLSEESKTDIKVVAINESGERGIGETTIDKITPRVSMNPSETAKPSWTPTPIPSKPTPSIHPSETPAPEPSGSTSPSGGGTQISGIKLNKNSVTLKVGEKDKLTYTVTPEGAHPHLVWRTDANEICSIEADGTITGVSVGEATISIKADNGVMDICNVKVVSQETPSASPSSNPSASPSSSPSVSPDGSTNPQQSEPAGGPISADAGLSVQNYKGMNYVLIIPDNATENLPLICFLHGSGERGSVNGVKGLPIVSYVNKKTAYEAGKFIFIAPVLNSGAWTSNENAGLTMELIEKVVQEFKVNKNKVVLTGMSLGGYGTWHIANKNPNYFSCIVPMSGGGSINAKNFTNLPVWAISGNVGDMEIDFKKSMTDLVNKINKESGKKLAKMEVISGASHSTIQQSYKRIELFKWMLSQTRN